MVEPPLKFASRKRWWANGMEIDTQNQEGDQVIQGEGGEGKGDEEMPPPEYQSWQEQPTPGACSTQEDNWVGTKVG